MELSGLVAILNETQDQVLEVRDLGGKPIAVKAGFARPLVDNKPALSATQEYTGHSFTIAADKVTRNWAVGTKPTNAELDLANLNATLVSDGSVVRALGLIMFEEINKLRVKNGDTAYTMNQFKAALAAKMRT